MSKVTGINSDTTSSCVCAGNTNFSKGYDNYEAYADSERMLARVQSRLGDKEKRKALSWMQKHDIKKQAKILQKKLSRMKADTINDEQATELLIQKEILELTAGKWLEEP